MTGRLCLLVVGEQQFATHWLPETGKVTLGRADSCEVRINEPSIAPQHAVLQIGSELTIEDLGSATGTRIADTVLEPGTPMAFLPGISVTLGSVSVVVQKSSQAPPRRIWTHGYFESRLEEECIRAERFKSQFSVLRVRCEPNVEPTMIEEILANILRLVDVVGSYRPGEYEVILQGTHPEGAELVGRRILTSIAERGLKAQIGVACYPRDGRSADALSERAGAAARGEVIADHAPHGDAPHQVADHGPMQHIYRLTERIAASMINVLIMGETGVGKERLAEMVHQRSPRADSPFLRLNVAALTETLLESELFGHERGAFTGAVQAKPGLLETAHGGTVFLDEIGELPMSIQVKLLRVLEGQQVFRVGSLKPRSMDVRFVAATNRDLEAEVARGAFRQDLFFRLNGISLVIPPLRERLSELPELAKEFIGEACRKGNRTDEPPISDEALALMNRYGWPGNIRELRNVVERAVLLCTSGPITLAHLPVEKMSATFAARQVSPRPALLPRADPTPLEEKASAAAVEATREEVPVSLTPPPSMARIHVNGTSPSQRLKAASSPKELRIDMRDFERQRILEALATCAGNQTAAAKMLGVSRRMLVNRLNLYGIPRPRKGRTRQSR
jgi:DNA-binding NtrC family response regulator